MTDQLIDVGLKLLIPVALALGYLLIKKAIAVVAKKLGIQISENEQALINQIIEDAVRATEEEARGIKLPSRQKEANAVAKAETALKAQNITVPKETLITKIKSKVNSIFNIGK